MPSPLDALINPGARQLPSPWASIPATPNGYIAGANGENVINNYREVGKYSSYPDARRGVIADQTPNLQTLSSGGQNHMQAWESGNPAPQKIQGPLAGMPYQLAKIAEKNLNTADTQINAFNEKARLFSFGSAHSDISQTVPIRQTGLIGSALDRKPYDQSPNTSLVSAGSAQPAVGVGKVIPGKDAYEHNPDAYTKNEEAY